MIRALVLDGRGLLNNAGRVPILMYLLFSEARTGLVFTAPYKQAQPVQVASYLP